MYSKKALVFASGVATASAACSSYAPYGMGVASIFKPDIANTPTIGAAYPLTFDGSAAGAGASISFELLRGPGNSLVSLGLIGSTTSCGTASCVFQWTPACTLEPDTTRYGIKLIDETNCMYQYTTQFGLAAGSCASPPPPASSSAAHPPPASSGSVHPQSVKPPTPSGKPSSSAGPHPPYPTSDCEDETVTAWTSVQKPKPTGGYVHTNATTVAPITKPTYTPVQANEAGRMAFGAFSGVVALAAAVLLL